jgi:hypothetical protein
MSAAAALAFERFVADRLEEQRGAVVRSWTDRICGLEPASRRGAPAGDLPESMPVVLQRAAEFLRTGDEHALTSDLAATEPLRDLARRRHGDGREPEELIRDFDLLAQVLDGACQEWLGAYPVAPPPEAIVRVTGRLSRAPMLMGEISIAAYREAIAAERHETGRLVRELAEAMIGELHAPLRATEGLVRLLDGDAGEPGAAERRGLAELIRGSLQRMRSELGDTRELGLAVMRQAALHLGGVAEVAAPAPGAELEERARWEQARVDDEVRHTDTLMRRAARRLAASREGDAREQDGELRWLRDEVLEIRRLGWSWEELAGVGMGEAFLARLGLRADEEA